MAEENNDVDPAENAEENKKPQRVELTAEGTNISGQSANNYLVLVTDDSRAMRSLACKTLNTAGMEALQACDGVEALDILKKNVNSSRKIDLVLMDLNMPNMDGRVCLRKIREAPDLRNTKVLVMTTDNDRKSIMLCVAMKVSGYILKPYTTDKLLGEVRRILASNCIDMQKSDHAIAPSQEEVHKPSIDEVTLAHLMEMIDEAMLEEDGNGNTHDSNCPVAKKLREAMEALIQR